MVEGRIAGLWVGEFARAAEEFLSRSADPTIDLSGVRYVDQAGADLLRSFLNRRVPIRGSSGFVVAMLEEPPS